MQGGMAVYESFFVWDEGKELAFYLTGATKKVWSRFAEQYVLTPIEATRQGSSIGEGKTRLTWTLAYDPIGTFGRIQFLVKPLMGVALGAYLKKLARYVKKQGETAA
jgi:hypothetical protein